MRDTAIGSTAPETRLIMGAPGAPRNKRKPGQFQIPPYSSTKRTLARTLTYAAILGTPGAPKYTLNASRTSSAPALKNELA